MYGIDYTELLNQLLADIEKGEYQKDGYLKVLRGASQNGYRPIIRYYHEDQDGPSSPEYMTVHAALIELGANVE